MREIDRAAAAALLDYLYTSVVPIVAEGNTNSGVEGSGLLFARDGKHFVITANHVAESVHSHPTQIGVPLAPSRQGAVWTLGKGKLGLTDTDGPDVAAFRIDDPDVISRLQEGGRRFVSDAEVLGQGAWSKAIVFGWPQAETTFDGASIVARPVHLELERMSPTAGAASTDIFLAWPDKKLPKLQGISGSPIWGVSQVEAGTIWHPSKQVLLVGVQHRVLEGSYIRGTAWEVVERVLGQLGAPAQEV